MRSMIDICQDLFNLEDASMTPERRALVDELDMFYKKQFPDGIPVICAICKKDLRNEDFLEHECH